MALTSSLDVLKPVSPLANVKSLGELGQLLRELRHSKNQTQADVAKALQLKTSIIQSLEIGDWKALPSEVYARGYVRRYSQLLGLSPEDATECCQRIQAKQETKLHYLEIATIQQTPPNWLLVLSAVAVMACFIGWSHFVVPRPVISPIIVAPDAVKAPAFTQAALQSPQCLSILSKDYLPCASTPRYPSLILINSNPYPIWMR